MLYDEDERGMPPRAVLQRWLELCTSQCGTMVVHCSGQLKKAPLLVAIALVESGLAPRTAIRLIRKQSVWRDALQNPPAALEHWSTITSDDAWLDAAHRQAP